MRGLARGSAAGIPAVLALLAAAAHADQNVTPTEYTFEVEIALCQTASCSAPRVMGPKQTFNLGGVGPNQAVGGYQTNSVFPQAKDFESFTHIRLALTNLFTITAAATTETDSDAELCVTGPVAKASTLADGIAEVSPTGAAATSQSFVISTNAASTVPELTVDVNEAVFIFAFADIPGFGSSEIIVPPPPNLNVAFDVQNTMEFEGSGAAPPPPAGRCRALFSTPNITITQ